MAASAKHILIGGGSGFIGKALVSKLNHNGNKISLISRSKMSPPPGVSEVFTWDQIKKEGLPKCDAIVNIPGAGLMDKRWSEQRKKELLDSRIIPTQILVSAIEKSKEPPKVLVSGSAIGYYPNNLELTMDENYSGPPGDNFSGKLCDEWEKTAKKLDRPGTRLVIIRTGVVFGPNGGALSKMVLPFKLGLGGVIGSGNQPFPWIHIEDEAGIMEHAINHASMTGPYLGIAPEAVDTTNRTFTKTLGEVLNRPTIFPVPETVAKIMFGEAYFNLTEGARLYPKRTIDSGYQYKFPRIKEALEDVMKHWK